MSPMPDSTLADPAQIIADLQRKLDERTAERDEYKAERDEALEQQTATAEVLQVINCSPRRVLVPGGIFGIYDQMREAPGNLTYPLPWATTRAASFVDEPETYKRLLTEAGFEIIWERSCREDALAAFQRQPLPQPGAALPPLGLHVTMGPGIIERGANFRIDFERGLIGPYEIIARSRAF